MSWPIVVEKGSPKHRLWQVVGYGLVVAMILWIAFRMENGEGILTYNRPVSANDVIYRVEISTDLLSWTQSGVVQQLVGTNGNGLQIWDAGYSGSASSTRFFRLQLLH